VDELAGGRVGEIVVEAEVAEEEDTGESERASWADVCWRARTSGGVWGQRLRQWLTESQRAP
jgi:hypothetical protein